MNQGNEKILAINLAKVVAIFAVLVNHTYDILYTNMLIAEFSFFSVSLFIMMSGVTYYLSRRDNQNVWKRTVSLIIKIIEAYIIICIIYYLINHRSLDVKELIMHIISFNLSSHFYFVALYLQIMLVAPIILKLHISSEKSKYKAVYIIIILILLIIFSSFSINNTNVFNLVAGAGVLGGGSYLICFYLGIIIARYYKDRIISIKSIAGFLICLVLLLAWYWFISIHGWALDAKLPFGNGINPPGITSIIMMLLWVGICYFLSGFLQKIKWISKSINFIASNTLYIFLYHNLILDYIKKYIVINNILVKSFIYIAIAILVSISLGNFFNYILNKIKPFYKN